MQTGDIRSIGVAGGGTIGFGIAVNFALAGYPTVIYDLADEVLERSLANVRAALELFVEEGLVTGQQADQAAARIDTTTDLERLAAHSDFITEAIVERLADKQELFGALDRLCAPGCIVVSNTSRLMLSDIAVHYERKDRTGLTHYFVPPHIVPGVEVAKGPGTSDETYEIMCELMPVRPLRLLRRLAMARRRRGRSQPSPGAERGGARQDAGTHGRAPPVVPRPGPHWRSRAGTRPRIRPPPQGALRRPRYGPPREAP